MTDLKALCWSLSELDAGLVALAQACGYSPQKNHSLHQPPDDNKNLDTWLHQSAEQLALQVQSVTVTYDDALSFISRSSPSIISVSIEQQQYYLLVLKSNRRSIQALTPQLAQQKLSVTQLQQYLCAPLQATVADDVNGLLAQSGVASGQRHKAANALIKAQVGHLPINPCWLLRFPSSRSFWQQIKHKNLHLQLAGLLGAHVGHYTLMLLGWWLIGAGVLAGNIEVAWVLAWGLLLLTQVPLQLFGAWCQGHFAIGMGGLIKKRLLLGTLQMPPEQLRQEGAGQMLGRVLDAQNIESVALQGGLLSLLALVELTMATAVLSAGAGGTTQVALLLVFMLGVAIYMRRQFKYRQTWTSHRLSMTHNLIEKMTGHRTRLAQQQPKHWHQHEDGELQDYVASSKQLDTSMARLTGVIPRLWLLIGFLSLAPAILNPATSSALLAVGIGGILLTYQALIKGLDGYDSMATAVISWQRIRAIFEQPKSTQQPEQQPQRESTSSPSQSQILMVKDLHYSYGPNTREIMKNVNLTICEGDRILLQGHSGSGKSTLATLMAGLATPSSGMMLLHGLDRVSMGEQKWREIVALSPQFHENHVLSESFAFNLLMGSQWPPTREKLAQARAICSELGLDELINKMPGDIMQMVGETGWQLSHGEKSRLYIARALLQDADLIVLDENFASLDPQTMQIALQCVMKHAKSLLVIAHP